MDKKISPSSIAGSVMAPASKSYAQRALAIASVAAQPTTLTNISLCNDTSAVLALIQELGAEVEVVGRDMVVSPSKKGVGNSLFIGESGLATRLFAPLASLFSHPITINGEGSILSRPIDMMEQPLRSAGVQISSSGGYLPLTVQGPLKGGEYELDGSLSSQFLTGLLIATPLSLSDTTLNVVNLKSKPYIDMTLEITSAFGVEIENCNYFKFKIKGGQSYSAKSYNIEGDWSGASCLLVAGAIAGDITVDNLQIDSSQADKAILKALELAGASFSWSGESLTVYKSSLKGFEFDATDSPDLFPALAILAAAAEGVSTLKGTLRLTHKESDRAKTVAGMLQQMSIEADISQEDLMVIQGGKICGGVTIDSANDHRIAMATATAALIATAPITIERSEAVNKSYPQFWDDIAMLIKE